MQFGRQVIVIIGAIVFAVIFGFILTPRLPLEATRYLAVGLGFGLATFVDEHWFQKNRRALMKSFTSAMVTVAALYLLDTIW